MIPPFCFLGTFTARSDIKRVVWGAFLSTTTKCAILKINQMHLLLRYIAPYRHDTWSLEQVGIHVMYLEFICGIGLMNFPGNFSPIHTSCECKCDTNVDVTNSQRIIRRSPTLFNLLAISLQKEGCDVKFTSNSPRIRIRRKYEPGLSPAL